MTAKQLTDSILQMAIQGKLVPQDPNDEPAAALLERIREEKRRLVKEGKLKKKDLEEAPISEDEVPFKIPESWEWARLGNIGVFERGNGIKKDETLNMGYPCVRYGEMYTRYKYAPTFSKTHSFTSKAVYDKCKKAYAGDIFMALTGENKQDIALAAQYVGKDLVAVGGDLCHFTVLNAYSLFFVYVINSKMFSLQKENLATGDIIVHISTDKLGSILIPVPPYSEQIRIVEKIKDVIQLIKEYGEAYEEASKMDAELPDKLKKSILQDAIMGKLDTQDPNDEPASVLLEHIREEKKRLVKEGKLKKKDLIETPVEESEQPFKIPESWEWCRMTELFSITSGLSYKKDDLVIQTNDMIRVLRGGNISFGQWEAKPDDIFIASQFVDNSLYLKKDTFITPAVSSLEHMGKTALIRKDIERTVVGGFILMLSPFFTEGVLLGYLNYMFQSYYYRRLCQSLTNKSGQAFYNLSRTKLLNAIIPLPPLAEQHRIVEKIEALFAEIDNMTINNINTNEEETKETETE